MQVKVRTQNWRKPRLRELERGCLRGFRELHGELIQLTNNNNKHLIKRWAKELNRRFAKNKFHFIWINQRRKTRLLFLKTPGIKLLAKGGHRSASHLQTVSRLDYWHIRDNYRYRTCSNFYVLYHLSRTVFLSGWLVGRPAPGRRREHRWKSSHALLWFGFIQWHVDSRLVPLESTSQRRVLHPTEAAWRQC